jgi:ABC-type multidrug transport system fused ATPase/permease subunit
MVALERVKEYSVLKREPAEFVEPRPAASWPSTGQIEIQDLVVRYAVSVTSGRNSHSGDAHVLVVARPPRCIAQCFVHGATRRKGVWLLLIHPQEVSFDKEQVGLLGRTGSGKSTLALSLFRFVEPTKGHILVDELDISQVGLTDLRGRMTIIPRECNEGLS